MNSGKDEALARRRAQNREAQRKFRLKQSQRKNQSNTNQAQSPQSVQPTAALNRQENEHTPPAECITLDPSNLSTANFTSSPCGMCIWGDVNFLDFPNIEGLMTPGSESALAALPSTGQGTDEFGLPTEIPLEHPQLTRSRADSTEVAQPPTPNTLYSSAGQWSTRQKESHASGSTSNNASNILNSGSDLSITQYSPQPSSRDEKLETSYCESSLTDDSRKRSGSNGWVGALHIAARKGHVRIVRVLLQHGTDCNEKDSDGLTPLIHAIIGDSEDVLSLLIQSDARIGEVDGRKQTALHWAVRQRRESLLKIMLQHCSGNQALIDSNDADGLTPLRAAVEMGFEAGVSLLLGCGASLNFKT